MRTAKLDQLHHGMHYRLTIEQDVSEQSWKPIESWQRIASDPGLDTGHLQTLVDDNVHLQIVQWFESHDYQTEKTNLSLSVFHDNRNQLGILAQSFENAYCDEPRMIIEWAEAPEYLDPNQIIRDLEYQAWPYQVVFGQKPNSMVIDWILDNSAMIKTMSEWKYIRDPHAWTRWPGKYIYVKYDYVATWLQVLDTGAISEIKQVIVE